MGWTFGSILVTRRWGPIVDQGQKQGSRLDLEGTLWAGRVHLQCEAFLSLLSAYLSRKVSFWSVHISCSTEDRGLWRVAVEPGKREQGREKRWQSREGGSGDG